MARCIACDGDLRTVYYQRRAADEPPDSVTFCETCPLDATKLTTRSGRTYESLCDASDTRRSTRRRGTVIIDKECCAKLCMLEVTGKAAARCWERHAEGPVSEQYNYVPTPMEGPGGVQVVELRNARAGAQTGYFVVASEVVGPRMTLLDVLEYTQNSHAEGGEVTDGVCIEVLDGDICGIVRRSQDGGRYTARFIHRGARNEAMELVRGVLERYGTELTLKSLMPGPFISSLYTRSCKAYDWAHAPDTGFVYSWKPDGERYWLVRYGSVWLYVKRLLSASIAGWYVPADICGGTDVGAVLDVEVVICFGNILLDVLAHNDGTLTPAVRSLEDVIESFHSIDTAMPHVAVKKYYPTIQRLMECEPDPGYPVDGVVGIEHGTTDIIKIKSTKSLELRLGEAGALLSSDGAHVASFRTRVLYPVGSIVEIRVRLDASSGEVTVVDSSLRSDKTTANSTEVCRDILRTLVEMPDSLSRRRAVTWCNDVRRKLHRVAVANTGGGRVILDVGAGDGQSISDYASDAGVSYILLEPDEAKCKKLARRLQGKADAVCKYYGDSTQLVQIIRQVSRGSVSHAIVCDTLERMISQDGAIQYLRGCVRCCVSSYSVSYVRLQLRDLALAGIEVVGCGYFYDDVRPGECIVNASGVTMKRTSGCLAEVTWGSDRTYTEPPVLASELRGVFYTRKASELIPIQVGSSCELLRQVSERLTVISTAKYI